MTSFTIPASVTTIEDDAFRESGLTSITIPSTVTTLGYEIFAECDNLPAIGVDASSNHFCSVEGALFNKNQTVLIEYPKGSPNTSFTIPASVTEIRSGAFLSVQNLTSLISEIADVDNVDLIGYSIFHNMNKTACTLKVPRGTKPDYESASQWRDFPNIEETANVGDQFVVNGLKYEVTSLAPNKVKVVKNDPAPANVVIPATVTDDINITYDVTEIAEDAFKDSNTITTLQIGENITTIDSFSFRRCSNLTTVTFSGTPSITTIGTMSFANCTSLQSFTIPNSVTTIQECAFIVTGLTSVTIPSSVTTIERVAFYNCTSLTSIEVDVNNTVYSSENGVLFNKNKTELIQYPIGKSSTDYTIPNSVTKIIGFAFSNCTNLSTLTIPNSVNNIGKRALRYCTGLTNLISEIENVGGVTMGSLVFEFMNQALCVLKVPQGKKGSYQTTDQWENFQNIQENTPTGICNTTVLSNPITIVGNNITISKVAGQHVRLYNLSGQVLYNIPSAQETVTLSVKQSGTYVVQVGNGTRVVKL